MKDRDARTERRRAEWTAPRERRGAARAPAFRHGALHVEALGLRAASVHRHEWAALAGRAIEPNPFFEPAFMAPLLHGLSPARHPVILVVRRRVAGVMRMVGLLPIQRAQARFAVGPLRAWSHAAAPMGVPLLDHDHAQEAMGALLAYACATSKFARGLALGAVDREGPVAGLLSRLTGGSRGRLHSVNPRLRPAFRAGSQTPPPQNRHDDTDFALAEGEQVLDALERHLALGSAQQRADPAFAALARAYAFALAREGRCVIAETSRGGALVGSGVGVLAGDLAVVWALAGGDDKAAVGARLAAALLGRPGVSRVELCASQTLAERHFPDRVRLADFLVAAVAETSLRPIAPWAR